MTPNNSGNRPIKWKQLVSVFLPIVILTGLAIVFSGSSSDSDCSGYDCSDSGADLSGACGSPVNVDKSGTVKVFQSLVIRSAQTDLRCGFGVSWTYNWVKDKKPSKAPPVSISVSTSKSGSHKVNKTDTPGQDGYSGAFNVGQGSVGGTAPMPGTITVTASWTDITMFMDSANVTLHLVYSSIKK